MANNENGSGIDYYELRRRHQEYKKNANQADDAQERPETPAVSARAADAPTERAPIERTPDAYAEKPRAPVQDVPEDDFPEENSPEDAFPQSVRRAEAYDADDEGDDGDDGADDSGANPFQSFFTAFQKIKGKLSTARAEKRATQVIDDSDDGYDEDEEPIEEKKGPFRFLRRREDFPDEAEEGAEEPEEAPVEDIADVADAPAQAAPEAPDAPAQEDVPAWDDEPVIEPEAFDAADLPEDEPPISPALARKRAAADDEDEDSGDDRDEDDDDEEDDDDAPRAGGVKRFLNLFVVREERTHAMDEEIEDADEPDEIGEPPRQARARGAKEYDDSLFTRNREHGPSEEERISMDDQEKKSVDMTESMASGLGEQTLSRRERRLLKERQANHEQALDVDSAKEASVDEPTREYKPVARPQTRTDTESASGIAFFDEDEPDSRKKAAKKDVYDGDEPADPKGRKKLIKKDDDDDDYDEPKSRKKSAKKDDDDFDEPKSRKKAPKDDYDDEDDFDEPKPRKKSRKDDYDDEDDYDEPISRKKAPKDDYDDEDDFEEPVSRKKSRKDDYDDEDDYGAPRSRRGGRHDDYDDEDEYDDDFDDDAPSFGHYVLGFLKILIAVVLILMLTVFGLYFADQKSKTGVAAYQWLRERVTVLDSILPPGETKAPDAAGAIPDFGAAEETTAPDFGATPAPDASASPEATATSAGAVG